MEFLYLCLLFFKKKEEKKKKKREIMKNYVLQFFEIFNNVPFNFEKINIDIKILFPRPHKNNQKWSKYPLFQLISTKLLHLLICGGPCTYIP